MASLGEQLYTCLIAKERWLLILEGLGNTLLIALGAIILGTLIGGILALMRLSNNWLLRGISYLYITIIRGVPMVLQLMIFYFVILAPIKGMPKMVIAIISFGVNSGAYVCEIFRAGIQSIPVGQTEAGRSLGLNKWQTLGYIVLPQAFKAVIPTYANEFIVLIKETAVAGYIAMRDLTKAADLIRNATFNAWIPLLASAVIYLCLTLGLAKLFGTLERRMARSDRR
ncbi:MAG: amino acid ABC transporter permease [Oscillospiraceae bacterium]|nr:amino acid ABC transporter permease [Oscillospiraceae bacterium]RKJ57939.1 amino acid ABC transporter permease [bacterium 1XD42-8]RKJ66740.1 amino acid ABC transporter permease [bacterium 1XD42-1]